ncbi:MAG: hypothetical protein WD056_01395 [Gemmatimonadota bacterium]
MDTRITIAVSFLLLVGCGTGGDLAQEYEAAFTDPEVARIYTRMMETMAPDRGWERARYLEFDWAIGNTTRHHRWDRWEGDVRYEVETQGQNLVALFNANEPTVGRVWLDGVELEGQDAEERLAGAYRAHINDSYWLIMPYKWADPGVTTQYLGEQTDAAGQSWEVVELAFTEDTGLTPQNRYHAFVNPTTGLMERWHHFSNADADPSPSDWTDWQQYGPIQLAENRRTDGAVRIHFPHLRVETSVPEGVFDPPAN